MKGKSSRVALISLLLLHATALPLFALPEDPVVEKGKASFEQPEHNTLNIAASNNTVINFSSFNIAHNETVNFIQPSSDSRCLSRVTGPSPSEIAGNLYANGILFLVNPNGIHITETAQIQIPHFVASTLDITTNNFVAGNYVFEHAPERVYAQLLNEGRITGKNIALIGSAVNNNGIIIAKLGCAHLASGDKATVSFDSRGMMQVEVNEEVSGKVFGIDGAPVKDAIANPGTIEAGAVMMSAKTAAGIFENALNQTGIVKATQLVEINGVIKLVSSGNAQVSGAMEALSIEVNSKESISASTPLNTKGNTRLAADKDITVNADITTEDGCLELVADNDLDGEGSFSQVENTTISTINFGDITIQSSARAMLANINSAGDLILKQGGLPCVFDQHPDSAIDTVGSLVINPGVTLNGANTHYEVGRDWINLGSFTPDISKVSLVSELPANVIGENTFYNFEISVPGKIVKFDTEAIQTIIGTLTVRGEYGKLIVLDSINPPNPWKINPQRAVDISFAYVGNSINARGPPLKAIHSSSLGNNTNFDLDPFWTGQGSSYNWSDPDNWDTGTVPTLFDIITFDGASGLNPNKNSVVDNAFNGAIDSLILDGYTGTITLARDLTLSGDFIRRTGNFNPAANAVEFIDASGPSHIGGNNTFYDLTCVTPGKTIIFEANTLTTITNLLTIEGSLAEHITLNSSLPGPGNEFNIYIQAVQDAQGNPYLEHLDVKDSIAFGSLVPIPAKDINKFNALDWDAERYWVGGAGTWDAADTTHWSASSNGAGGASVPGASDNVYFDSNSGSGTVELDATVSIIDFSFAASGITLDLNDDTFTVSGDFEITAGALIEGTSTVIFSKAEGIQAFTIGGTGEDYDFYNIQHTAGGTLTLGSNDLSLDGDFTNSDGVLNVVTLSITVAGDFTNSGDAVIMASMGIDIDINVTGTLNLNSSAAIDIYSTWGGGIDLQGCSTIVLGADTTLDTYNGDAGEDAGDILFDYSGSGTINGAYVLTLDTSTDGDASNGGDVYLCTIGNSTAPTALSIDATSSTSISGVTHLYKDITVDGNITFTNMVLLEADIAIDTDSDGTDGNILFGDSVSSDDDTTKRDLTLTAGTGSITFTGPVGGRTYQILHEFTGSTSDGSQPTYLQFALSGSTLYGMTSNGGTNDSGTIFSIETDGSGFSILKSFDSGSGAGNSGNTPHGSLTLSGNTLYGMTTYGGTNNDGTIFSIDTDGSDFTVLYNFLGYTSSDGANPTGDLLLSDGVLYGMTDMGGSSSSKHGTIFKIDINGDNYEVLRKFEQYDGEDPHGGLVISGDTLYGMTYRGGSGLGLVFSMDIDGTGFAPLHVFTGDADGGQPWGNLTLSGTTLYGMTASEGSLNSGVIFSVETNGSGFDVLRDFGVYDALKPYGELILVRGVLYGLGSDSWTSATEGALFSIEPDGSNYTIIRSFLGGVSDGATPKGSLMLSGSTAYGVTFAGGDDNLGTIFSYGPLGGDLELASLDVLTIVSAGSVTCNSVVDATTITLTDTDGAITFNGDLTATTVNTAAQGYSVVFNEDATITNDCTFVNTGGVTLGNGDDDILLFNGGLDTTASTLTARGLVRTSGDQMDVDTITMSGGTLVLDTTNNWDTAAGAILNIAGVVTGGDNNLTVISGNGATNFSAVLSRAAVNAIDTLTLQGDNADATGAVTFNGDVTAETLVTFGQNYHVKLKGQDAVITNDCTFLNTGGVTFGYDSNDVQLFNGGLDTTVGTTTITGNVRTSSDQIDMAAVTLGVGPKIDTTNNWAVAGAAINITGALTGDYNTLSLVSGTGATTCSSTVGTINVLTLQGNNANATGAMIFNGDLTAITITTFAQAYATVFNEDATITNDCTFNNTNGVTLGNANDDIATFNGGVDTSASATNIAGTFQTSDDALTIGAGTVTVGTTTISAGTNTVTVSTSLDIGAYATIIEADEIDFSGGADSVDGTGALTLRPSTDAATIGIGGAAGTLGLTVADIAAIDDGFSLLTIGRAAGSGRITIDAITFDDSTTISSPAGSITVNGQITGSVDAIGGTITLDGSGATTTLNADIVTAGVAVTISDNVEIDAATVAINTASGVAAGANITITGTINSVNGETNALTLNAGTGGTIDLQGAIGATDLITTLTITNSNGTTFGGATTVTTMVLTDTTDVQTVTFEDNLVAATLTTIAEAYNLTLEGAVNTITNDCTFVNTGTLNINDDAGDVTTFIGGLDTTGVAGVVTLGGTVNTTNTRMDIGVVTLATATTLDTGNNAAAILNLGVVTSATNALILDSGATAGATIGLTSMADLTGGLTIRDAGGLVTIGQLGNGTAGNVTITDSSLGVAFTATVNAATVLITDTTDAQTITFQDNLVATALTTAAQGYSVVFNEDATITNDCTFANTGGVTLGNGDDDILLFNDGLDTTASTLTARGLVRTSGDQMDIGTLTISGGTLTIDTTNNGGSATGANMNFTTINGIASLALNAGTAGDINITGAIGATTALTGLTVVSANNVTFSGNISVAGDLEQTAGTGTTSFANGSTVDIDGSVTIGATASFDANSSSWNVGDDWANSGIFTADTSTVTFDTVANVSQISGETTFNNLRCVTADKQLTFEATKTQIVTGTFTLTGAVGELIVLRSTVEDTQWNIDPQGDRAVSYVDVKDSNNINAVEINGDLGDTSVDSGNNINWAFGKTFSGIVYIDEGITAIGVNITIAIAVNGAAADKTAETEANGEYTLSSVGVSDGDVIIVYIDDETEKGCVVTVVANEDLSGLDIYQNRVIVRNDYAAGVGYTTNANLAAADNGDADIKYSVSGNSLTLDSGQKLFIWSSNAYQSSGNVSASTLDIRGMLNVEANTIHVLGNVLQFSGTFSGTSPTLNVDGYIGTKNSIPTFSISGTMAVSAGSMLNNVSVYINGTGNYNWSSTIPGFVFLNGKLVNSAGQNQIRGQLITAESAFYQPRLTTALHFPVAAMSTMLPLGGRRSLITFASAPAISSSPPPEGITLPSGAYRPDLKKDDKRLR